jgi:outer membrane protein assembly factor BamB
MKLFLTGAFRVAVLVFACSHAPGGAAVASEADQRNWPQWRGPLATGVAPLGDPPAQWSETNNVKWKFRIPGFGTSTPIIWENQVFIQTAIATGKLDGTKTEASAGGSQGSQPERRGQRSEKPSETYQFTLLCLDRQTGKILWQKIAREEVPHESHHPDHGFSSASPVTDGKHVFACFGSHGLYCYDMDGSLQWQKDLGDMRTKNSFGEGSSPALHGKSIVIVWDHEGDDFIVALNKHTGEELWRQAREESTTWSTPLIVEHEGKNQVVVSATEKIRSYDLEAGNLLWECAGMTANSIPSPVSGHGMLFAMSGFRGNAALAIRLGKSGDLTGTDAIAWSHQRNTPYVPSPLLYGDLLYFFSGNNAMLSVYDAKSGRAYMDAERLTGMFGVYASPVGASGRVYLTGRDGNAMVVRKSDKLEVLSTNKLDDKFDASPAIVGTELFLRGHQHLYCIAEK